MTAVITSEPRVYGPESDASYFQDIGLASLYGVPGAHEARERLTRYQVEIDVAIASPTTVEERAEGRRALARGREGRREDRSGGSSSTLAGFTTPVYLTADWASFRSPARAFVDQCTKLPLPEYGLQVNIPSFSSTTGTGTQTENSGTDETDPSGANIQANLSTQAGLVSLSQQLFDRGGLPGAAFDKLLIKQMGNQLDASIDLYVINQVLASAAEVTDSTTGSIATLYNDLALAREKLTDTAGTRLVPTHLFSTSDLYSWATRQLDDDHRPILTPDSGAIVQAATMADPAWRSWTGVHIGPLRWHTDDNIPALSGNTQILVSRPDEVYVFDGEEISFAYPDTQAEHLSVVVGLRAYVAAILRFSSATAYITGSSYPVSLV